MRNSYGSTGLLEREVTTSYQAHEWDAIREYSYQDTTLVHLLFGNNHTGRWGSEGYGYNERGDLESVEHYRKNGVLGYRTLHDLHYDDQGRLSKKVTTKVVVPIDSSHADWENELAIGDSPNPHPDAAAAAKTTTTYLRDAKGRPTSVEVRDYLDRVTVSTVLSYRAEGHTETSTYYDVEVNAVDFRETSDYDELGRMVRQTIGGAVTRYAYAGRSSFVIGRR